MTKHIWREGALFDISPIGTGFIKDSVTGKCHGFHVSMLEIRSPNPLVDGQVILFKTGAQGVCAVKLPEQFEGAA